MPIRKKRASTVIFLTLLVTALVFPTSAPRACGWWGDGEDEDSDAITVLPEGKSEAELTVEEALRLLKTSDSPKALTQSADRLLNLIPTPIRSALAVKVLTKAARLGFAPAQNNLAVLLEQGKGIRQDNRQAAIWFRKAARQGEPHAQHSLAMMYFHGRGVSENKAKARKWLERSARQGHVRACLDFKTLFGKDICAGK